LLGELHKGFNIAMATLDGGRIGIAAQALGIGQRALDESTKYAKEREAFGQKIADFQAIQWKLADMATEIEAARLLTYRAAQMEEGRFAASRPNGLCLRSVSACEMQTQVLYMEDRRGQDPDPCYLREFDANVLEIGPDFVILDRTAFYAEGGGQPYDTGTLSWSGQEAKVLRVTKEKGVIRHHVDRLPPVGPVRGTIDWDRRYAHMRYHTSQHIMSGLVWKIYGART